MVFLLNLRFSDTDIAVDMIWWVSKVQANKGFVLTWYDFASAGNFNAALKRSAAIFG
jgi:hypothetical protein